MSWKIHQARLAEGQTVQFRPTGHSMKGKIDSGQLVTVEPMMAEPKKGDIVFCRVRGHFYVHLVVAVKGERYQIGNNHGHINGWVGKNALFGKVVRIED